MSTDKTKSILKELVFSRSQQWIKRDWLDQEYVVVKCSLHDAGGVLEVAVLMPPCNAEGPLCGHIDKRAVVGEIWELADRLCSIKRHNIVIVSPEKEIVLWAPWDGRRLIYPYAGGTRRRWRVRQLMLRQVVDILRKFVVYKRGVDTCKKCNSEHKYIEFYTGDGWQKISNCVKIDTVLATIVDRDGRKQEIGVMKSQDPNHPGWVLVGRNSYGFVDQVCKDTFKTIDVARQAIQKIWGDPEWKLEFE
ncbi:MAG: hypothetical protein ACPL1K_03820 [Candidatus Kryptoniota bacterium]